tara:strand:- start:2240 stop:3250 length:1011 start_codon:yes stop_codon:yes gene_type:complete
MKNKIICVTGGSGFIGTNALDSLLNNNFKVINFDINPPKNSKHIKFWKKVDLRNYDMLFLELEKEKPTHILHLAADLGMEHKSLDNLKCNTIGVENLVKAINKIKSIERVVFTSSLLVCENGYIPKNELDYCPPNFYGKSKVIGEMTVRNSKINCEWAIIRPTSIWGPYFDYSYKKFFQIIDQNKYFHFGKNEFQKPASYVGNTVYMMLKILFENKSGINKNTFYLADYPWYSTRKWSKTIQNVLNSKPIRTAPLWILSIVAFFGDILKFFKFDPPLTSFRLNNILTGGEYSIKNTMKIVGKLPYSLNQSVFETAQWMYENNLIKHKPKNKNEKNR